MQEKFEQTVKAIGNRIVDLSTTLAPKLTTWTDIVTRPNEYSSKELVGIINMTDKDQGVNLVLDLAAPDKTTEAVLRLWSIEIINVPRGNNLFNNIQLDFSVDYATARIITATTTISRDEIRKLLALESTKIKRVAVSNKLGRHKQTGESLGERFVVEGDSFSNVKLVKSTEAALGAVIIALESSAKAEANRLFPS